jgi:hypothetical protein
MNSVGISNVDSVLTFSGWTIGLVASILIWFLKADPIYIGLVFIGVIVSGALVIGFCIYCVKLELKRGILALEHVRTNHEIITGFKIIQVKNMFNYCELTLVNDQKFVVGYGKECNDVANNLSDLVIVSTRSCEQKFA